MDCFQIPTLIVTMFQALTLGIIQGLTEFLPVSSSGHLVLAEQWFSLYLDQLSMQGFNVLLHAGTLLALVILYWSEWQKLLLAPLRSDSRHRMLLLALMIGTVPGGIVGLLWEEQIARLFSAPETIGGAFLMTALILFFGERSFRQGTAIDISFARAGTVGLFQAAALIPGLSRSGLTISAGRFAGLSRKEALDFSFLLAAPIIGGATVVSLVDAAQHAITLPPMSVTIIGFVASFISSAVAIRFLRTFVVHRRLTIFCWYLVPMGIFLLVYS
jgi:undecaprenyl-diphosphatase